MTAFVILTPAANSATIEVTTTKDQFGAGGKCALREAVRAANTNARFGGCPRGNGPDTIRLPGGTFRLSIEVDNTTEDADAEGDIDVLANTTIVGRGALRTIVDGNSQHVDERIFDQLVGANLKLTGLTLRNGQVRDEASSGGAVLNEGGGRLTVLRCHVTGNFSEFSGGGLAADSGGTIVVSRSLIADNIAEDLGGGVSTWPDGGAMVIRNSQVVGNYADKGPGGIVTLGGRLTLIGSKVSGNTGGMYGGGIDIGGNGALIRGSTISDNRQTTVGYFGGGIYDGANTGTVVIQRSTISRNFGTTHGGGIYAKHGTWRIANSTISGNVADDQNSHIAEGGGIFNDGAAISLESVTLAGNRAADSAGIYADAGTLSMRNSIVARNRDDGDTDYREDCFITGDGTVNSLGHNLIGDGSCDPRGSDLFGASNDALDPRLGVLAANGGRTATQGLLPGSPAINRGKGCPKRDQRGFKRRGRCDIGAFERQ